MPINLQQLLQELEEITAEAVRAFSPSDGAPVELQIVGDLIHKRGILIAKLPDSIAGGGPFSYTDSNRMLILQVQGRQIDSDLRKMRVRLVSEITNCGTERAYAGCINGMVNY
jgi:hypothetical protein